MVTFKQHGRTRRITHGRQAAERLARRWFKQAGVPLHYVGFSENPGFYLIIHCLVGRGKEMRVCVPCWGASALRYCVNEAINAYKEKAA